MIVDTSAIMAILRDEPEESPCARTIADATDRRVSAVNFVETAVVIDASRDPIATRLFDDFIAEAKLSIEPVRNTGENRARGLPRFWQKAVGTRRSLISVTVLLMRLPSYTASHCCSKAGILFTRISFRRCLPSCDACQRGR